MNHWQIENEVSWGDVPIQALQNRVCSIIGTTAALIGAGIASAAGGIASSAISSSAASKAAETQSEAAKSAAELEAQTAREYLDWEKEMWNQVQEMYAPYQEAGESALASLSAKLGLSGDPTSSDYGSLLKSYSGGDFVAPTLEEAANEPGYKFAVQQGQQAIERSAAAKGGVLSGGTAKALERYGQEMGELNYENAYNRKFNEWQTAFNKSQVEQSNVYNRLMGLTSTGQETTQQLASSGLSTTANMANIATTSASNQADALQDAAAARASGYASSGNIWGSTLSGLSELPLQYYMMKKLLKG